MPYSEQPVIDPASSRISTESLPEAAATPAAVVAPAAETKAAPVKNGFAQLGLAPSLLQAVADLGFTDPTPVQARAIPLALAGERTGDNAAPIDLMVSSQTGSGKTAAYLLPVLNTLLAQQEEKTRAEAEAWERRVAEAAAKGEEAPRRPKRRNPTDPRNFRAAVPGALILCPTRELAQQVAHDAIDLLRHTRGVRIAAVIGGLPYGRQIAQLQNASLVVATPGRLLDLQRSNQIRLEEVQFLVADEADRMLDLGFADDLAEIHRLTAARRQTMMFSATFEPRIQQLASRVMRDAQRIQIDSPQQKNDNIEQRLYWADDAGHKRRLLDHWLRDASIDQAIVFASTQVECDALAEDLQQAGFAAAALHGALSQGLRNRRLSLLRNGQIQFLVATDVAARGIDVPTITHVFNFGLPMKAEDYVHRIGRTGRAGRHGLAITFAEPRDRRRVYDIERYTRQPFQTATVEGMEPNPQNFSRDRRHTRDGGRGGRGGSSWGGRPADNARFDRRADPRRGGFRDDRGVAGARGGEDARGGAAVAGRRDAHAFRPGERSSARPAGRGPSDRPGMRSGAPRGKSGRY